MKQSLTREDAAFAVMKEQPAKGGTVLPRQQQYLSDINNLYMH